MGYFEGIEIEDLDMVFVARADVELLQILAKQDAARALPDLDGVDDLRGGDIDDADSVVFFVRHVRGLGPDDGGSNDHAQHGEELDRLFHHWFSPVKKWWWRFPQRAKVHSDSGRS